MCCHYHQEKILNKTSNIVKDTLFKEKLFAKNIL